jgi:hypothetical protein
VAGTHKKGTNDADGDGKQGGSLPGKLEDRVAKLETELAAFRDLARANGWSHA